jgi:hypothetical protein
MRSPTVQESAILEALSLCEVKLALLQITATALEKGYTDATLAFREFLQSENIHDFSAQNPGESSIRYVEAVAQTADGARRVTVSFQRPAAKEGRMYRFSKLGSLRPLLDIQEDDILSFFVRSGELHVINLTDMASARRELTLKEKSRGAQITTLAKAHLLHVMRCMPECASGRGSGARAHDISDLCGFETGADTQFVSLLLEMLCGTGELEVVKTKTPKRYRLCH